MTAGVQDGWVARRATDALGHYVLVGAHLVHDVHLSDGALRLYQALRLLAGPREFVVVSLSDLAVLMELSVRQVSRRRDELATRGVLTTRAVPRTGLCWTFRPPDLEQMAVTFDGLHARTRGDDDAATPDMEVPVPMPARRQGVGQRADRGWGSADTQVGRESEKRTEKTTSEDLAAPDRRRISLQQPEVLAEALAHKMNGMTAGVLGMLDTRGLSVPVTRHQLRGFLEAGEPPQRLLAAWHRWLTQVAMNLPSDVSGDAGLAEYMSVHDQYAGRGSSRPIWFHFVDWLYFGGEVASHEDFAGYPVDEMLDLKRAAAVLRRKRPSRRN